jgi:DNA (cytosine-5)-methyltransferase 1
MIDYKVLDLFSGIGGFSLGLERAGMETIAFCEIEPYCRKVLKKHWPDVPIYEDVRNVTRERLEADGITGVSVITGGFPCQDISLAGKQAGINGNRSGLWGELARIIGEIRPKYAIVENVTALLSGERGRWFGRVLGDLAEIGYSAEWHCIPASEIGAPHHRDRVWVIAYPGQRTALVDIGVGFKQEEISGQWDEKNAHGDINILVRRLDGLCPKTWWRAQSRMARSINGLPDWMDRCGALGNAVVPQIPEIIGRAIMQHEQ